MSNHSGIRIRRRRVRRAGTIRCADASPSCCGTGRRRSVGSRTSLPIGRPAVSKHLGVLEHAGIVTPREHRHPQPLRPGARRLRGRAGLAHRHLGHRPRRLPRRRREGGIMTLPPIRRHLVVRATPEHAYRVVHRGHRQRWWPLERHSVVRDRQHGRLRGRRDRRAVGGGESTVRGARDRRASRPRGSRSAGTRATTRSGARSR